MNRTIPIAVLLAALAGAACAAPNTTGAPAASEGLVALPSRTLDALYLRPNVDLSSYRKVLVDPAQAALDSRWLKDMNGTRSVGRWLVPADAQRITDEAAAGLSAVVTQTFAARGYEIVTVPGEGVLRLSPAIADLFVNAPYAPTPGIQVGFVRDAGDATLSLDVRDAKSGALLARVVDRNRVREIYLVNRATGVDNLFWLEAMYREWAEKCAAEFAGSAAKKTARTVR